MFAIMVTPNDLDLLRNIFGEHACDDATEGYELAKRAMRAVHRTAKKHGFRWEY
jgi:hypothetical protein